MRKLTAKQKKLLTQEWNRLRISGIKFPRMSDAPYETYLDIDNINPCEIYSQNTDYLFNELNNKIKLDTPHNLWYN